MVDTISKEIAKFLSDTCKYMLDKLKDDNNTSITKDDTVERVIDSI